MSDINFFLLRPDGNDEEEARSSSSLVAPDACRIFDCRIMSAAPPMSVFFYSDFWLRRFIGGQSDNDDE